jgi:hypothetical protein
VATLLLVTSTSARFASSQTLPGLKVTLSQGGTTHHLLRNYEKTLFVQYSFINIIVFKSYLKNN